jgi:C-terminal processing protease CtpA/Prc
MCPLLEPALKSIRCAITSRLGLKEQIGYIRLTQFSANAAEEMGEAIEDLETQGVTGYILRPTL